MHTIINLEDDENIKAIVEGVSTLPLEKQECILAAIKGMLFSKKNEEKEKNLNNLLSESEEIK